MNVTACFDLLLLSETWIMMRSSRLSLGSSFIPSPSENIFMTICDAFRVFIDLNGELEIYDIRNISLSIHFNVRLKLIYSEINLIYLTARLMKHNFTPLFISQMICLDIFFHLHFFT